MFLKTTDLGLTYHDGENEVKAVRDVNIDFPEHGFYGIIGPSGSGKTSLLYLLSGIRRATTGEVFFDGAPLPTSSRRRNRIRRESMGFVFQFHFLINYLNVEQNILVGAKDTGRAAKSKVRDLMKRLGLYELRKRKSYQLSGGQRQRVAIGRALANNPKVVFVDEPTSSLDHKTGFQVMELLKDVAKTSCVIVVTHDPTILDGADTIFKMWDGTIVETVNGRADLNLSQEREEQNV